MDGKDWTGSELFVVVRGTPRPLPRPRVVDGRAVSIVGKAAKAWRRGLEVEIGQAVRRAQAAREWPSKGFRGVYSVTMEFAFSGRNRGSGGGGGKSDGKQRNSDEWHTKRPDVDNLAKMVLDAMEVAGVMRDDCEVAELVLRKRIVGGVDGPYVAVTCQIISADCDGSGLDVSAGVVDRARDDDDGFGSRAMALPDWLAVENAPSE